jgi:hypothetical protein
MEPRVNEEVLAYQAKRRQQLRALSWEEKVELIERMRDSLVNNQWKRPSQSSTEWKRRRSSEDTR